jgi:hypothetical protein
LRDCEKKDIRRIADLQRELMIGHRKYIMRYVIGTLRNVNVIGSMKMK